jgi:Leucine Rich repeat
MTHRLRLLVLSVLAAAALNAKALADEPSAADKALLTQILALDAADRAGLIARLADKDLQKKMTALLPEIEPAAKARRKTLTLEADIKEAGGKIVYTPSGPQWLYFATNKTGAEIFDIPTAIDLYNGNNPLKGKGGRNDKVTDDWLKRLSGASTLQRLDLANCSIQGEGLQYIAGLTALRELNLTLTPVKDDALKHLGGLTELRSLGLASTQCNGTGFVHLKALKKLENVNFHFTPLNDDGLRAIAQVPINGRLWFAHTKFTDEGAASLANLTQLKRCGLGSTAKGSSGEAVAALTKLPLEDLSLLDNQATPAGVGHAAKIATLRRLDVSHGPTVKDESMPLVAQMPVLEEFKLGSALITDEGLRALGASKSLKKLSLSGVKGVTPAGIEKLRKAQPKWVIEVN